MHEPAIIELEQAAINDTQAASAHREHAQMLRKKAEDDAVALRKKAEEDAAELCRQAAIAEQRAQFCENRATQLRQSSRALTLLNLPFGEVIVQDRTPVTH
jgi:hypothetical protein